VRVHLDAKADLSMGRRATDWELKGVPVRLEVGPRDLAEGVATLVRRTTGDQERKSPVALDALVHAVTDELDRQQAALLDEATALRESRTSIVATIDEAREAVVNGWARIPWSTIGTDGEGDLAQGGVTVRCLLRSDGSLPESDAEDDLVALVARSY
jgi:prolyl-tRNA synthetase